MGTSSHSHPRLPTLTLNRPFIQDFLAAEAPCFALGLVEERGQPCGLFALRPGELIPPEVTGRGFQFGHSLLGTTEFEVIHFAFEFYGFETYNVLVNPNNPLVQAVLRTILNSGDYFFFALGPNHQITAFRSEIGQGNIVGLREHWPRLQRSTTSEGQYRQTVQLFETRPHPEGTLLRWVCRDRPDYLDLTGDSVELRPA